MQSLQIFRASPRHDTSDRPDLHPCGIMVRAGCPVCQGPLLLAACLGVNPAGPAQRVYRCAACDHLEWVERPREAEVTH